MIFIHYHHKNVIFSQYPLEVSILTSQLCMDAVTKPLKQLIYLCSDNI